jgi:exo-beta-1,3-glucanase (GH17 family)
MLARAFVLLVLVGAAAAAYLHARTLGEPVVLVDAPRGRLQCVSYAPYHQPGQTPLVEGTLIPPAQIDADLARLARITDCVRTYSIDQGLDAVPRLAKRHGLKVMMGVWIGRDAVKNEQEIERALEIVKRERDSISAIIVGNEVLLRREQPPAALQRIIERFRRATPIPVTYADVWEFWLRNRELAASVSFVTVHILPYWEDEPVAVENAIAHVRDVHRMVRDAFPGKHVLIGETGWPSAGRNRHGAQPGPIEQARFVREFLVEAQAAGATT